MPKEEKKRANPAPARKVGQKVGGMAGPGGNDMVAELKMKQEAAKR